MRANSPTLGILLLDTTFPRIPGDVGNELSYPFPVRIKTVPNATVQRVIFEADPRLREFFLEAAQELVAEGVAALTSSCGFLSVLQNDIAQAVAIPVFLSSLLQVPLAHALTHQRVAIVTANSQRMTRAVLESAGITADIPIALAGLEDVPVFRDPILQGRGGLDRLAIEKEIVLLSQRLLHSFPDIGAFVLECHNLAPYAQAVQQATGKPVFDIIDFASWVHKALDKPSYPD